MPYVIFGYEHSIRSRTNQKTNISHQRTLDTKGPFDADLILVGIINNNHEQRQKTQLIFKYIKLSQVHSKRRIEDENQSRERTPCIRNL